MTSVLPDLGPNLEPDLGRRSVLRALASVAALWALSPRLALAVQGDAAALDAGLRAQSLLDTGDAADAAQAMAVLQDALDATPDEPWLWGLMGRASLMADDAGGAVVAFRKAVALSPEDTYSRMMLDMLSQQALPTAEIPIRLETPEHALLRGRAQAEQQEYLRESGGTAAVEGAQSRFSVRRIVLDAGHGGFDPGAVGPTGLREKDVALALARQVAADVRAGAPEVAIALTRSDDYYLPLSARTAAANRFGADLFVSLHSNASRHERAGGVETYSCSEEASSTEAAALARYENAVSRFDVGRGRAEAFSLEDIVFRFERRRYWDVSAEAARLMQERFADALPFRDRGAQHADFHVLRKARMPSVLLEMGFISNPQEERLLRDRRVLRRMARTIAEGLLALHRQGVRT